MKHEKREFIDLVPLDKKYRYEIVDENGIGTGQYMNLRYMPDGIVEPNPTIFNADYFNPLENFLDGQPKIILEEGLKTAENEYFYDAPLGVINPTTTINWTIGILTIPAGITNNMPEFYDGYTFSIRIGSMTRMTTIDAYINCRGNRRVVTLSGRPIGDIFPPVANNPTIFTFSFSEANNTWVLQGGSTYVKNVTVTGILSAANWIGTEPPYTNTFTGNNANQLRDIDVPHVHPIYSEDNAIAILQNEAWNLIGKVEATQNVPFNPDLANQVQTGRLVFTCFEEKPTVDLRVMWEIMR